MNARAKQIGMTHSLFASPSGLDADAEKRADVDGGGTVNSVDASIILTYAAAQGLSDTPLDLKDFIPKS